MAVNRFDLLNPTFSKCLRGYCPEEVDGFLQEIADIQARMHDERTRFIHHITQLETRIAEYGQREAALRDALIASRNIKEDIKQIAQKEAQVILDIAQTQAENLTNQANLRLARVLDEISEARKIKIQLVSKIKAVIDNHMSLLELEQEEDDRATSLDSSTLLQKKCYD